MAPRLKGGLQQVTRFARGEQGLLGLCCSMCHAPHLLEMACVVWTPGQKDMLLWMVVWCLAARIAELLVVGWLLLAQPGGAAVHSTVL